MTARIARPAFSLIEVLVVLVVLAVLIGIIVSVLASGKQVAEQVTSLSTLRSLGSALRSYMDQESRGILPAFNGYHDQGTETGDFTRIVPMLARHLEIPEPRSLGNSRFEPQAPFVSPLDDEIGPAWGMSYDYFPGALMINYRTTGRLDPALAVPVTRRYELGEYEVLFADILPWQNHPIDGRMAVFWDGSAGPIQGN